MPASGEAAFDICIIGHDSIIAGPGAEILDDLAMMEQVLNEVGFESNQIGNAEAGGVGLS